MPYFFTAPSQKEMTSILQCLVAKYDGQIFGDNRFTPVEYSRKYFRTFPIIWLHENGYIRGLSRPESRRPIAGRRDVTLDQFIKIKEAEKLPFVKADPSFYMGFEIEGCIDEALYNELCAFVYEIYPRDCRIHRDGSLRTCKANFRPFEISTPPLAAPIALQRLEKLLDLLTHLSEAGLFETNKTCGFHVSISDKKIFSASNPHGRLGFAYYFMRAFEPRKWRKIFGRSRNRYCTWKQAPADAKAVNHPIWCNHYSAINTQSLNHADPRFRRIEVRVAGNDSYHKNENIGDFLFDICEAMRQAHASL